MTPLETAAKAYELERSLWSICERHPPKSIYTISRADYESGTSDIIFETDDHGDAHVQFDRLRNDASMRAALLALAECELPMRAIAEGKNVMPVETKYWIENGSIFARHLADHDCVQPEEPFRAILRSIATEGTENNG